MIVLIDNYDSFSYNVYQLIGSVEPDIKVVRNDEVTIKELELSLIHIQMCIRDRIYPYPFQGAASNDRNTGNTDHLPWYR